MTPRLTPRMVPDPSMTDAEFYHQQGRELDRVSRTGAKPNPNVGKVHVMENAMTRIGGLALVRSKSERQEKAAEKFKALYEALYGGYSPAVDPERVPVDISPVAHDGGMAAKLDRAEKLRQALSALGKQRADLIIGIVVLGISCRDYSDSGTKHGQMATKRMLLASLDHLATFWGL